MGDTGRTLACPECRKPCLRGSKFCAHCGTLLTGGDLDLLDPDGDGAPPPGTLVGSYRLIATLGEGGMGRVHVAEHVKLGRRVAVKKLRRELAANPGAAQRLFAEARAVNRILHENIVEITDIIEQPGGDNYLIMELLKGEDLARRLVRGRTLPLVRAFGIASQIASALAAVHAAGMIHRDLKPDNIFLIERAGNPDFVKVLDFGIAMHSTAAGQIAGTPEYMAPEQARGEAIDARADIYALGVIVYEMITGALPFEATSLGELRHKHMTVPVELPRRQPGLAPGLQNGRDQLLLDLLAKDPADRPASMDEVDRRLRELLDAMMRSSGLPSGAEAVAKLALRRRPTPMVAVEIATPRSVSRIDVLTPSNIQLGLGAKPVVPSPMAAIPSSPVTPALGDPPRSAARMVPTLERLPKPSSDAHARAEPKPTGAQGPGLAGVEPGREATARVAGAAGVGAPVAAASGEPSHPLRPGVSPQPAIRRWRRVVLGGAAVIALAGAIVAQRLGYLFGGTSAVVVQPSEVKIKFVSAPPGAEVRLAGTGELIGVTPFIWSFPRGERAVTVELAKPGFATVTQGIPLGGDDAVAVVLAPMVVVTPAAPPPVAPPGSPTAPDPDRPHSAIPAKRTAPRPLDRPMDRNGTMDVFKQQ